METYIDPIALRQREITQTQVDWYLVHGQHGTRRVRTNSNGLQYVIGDDTWNSRNPELQEFITKPFSLFLKEKEVLRKERQERQAILAKA